MKSGLIIPLHTKIIIFQNVALCCLIYRYKHFRGTYWIHLQSRRAKMETTGFSKSYPATKPYDVISQKIVHVRYATLIDLGCLL
jgi:hypothetical protein